MTTVLFADGGTPLVYGLLAIPVLIFINAFFVAAEFALVAIRRTRVEELVNQGRPRAAALLKSIDALNNSVAAAQLGITVASLALGLVSEPAIHRIIVPLTDTLPGSGNADLPSFLVLNGGLVPPGGLDNFNSGFLPAAFQGSVFRPGKEPIANIVPVEKGDAQRRKLDLIRKLDDANAARTDDAIDTAIRNYETAYRMQTSIPDLLSLEKETAATKTMYGVDSKNAATAIFGAQCLLARRLVERGAKFIELTCPNVGHDRWDQHKDLLGGHTKNALAVDQPIGALLEDLKRTGMLKDTLVVWAGEFGRTPFAQGGDGRDHNPFGYSVWLAGGGVKGGVIHGATDDFGYKVVKDRVEMHDLHATMLHLLGIDHKKLTFRFGGRDMRLTDVHGELVTPILA